MIGSNQLEPLKQALTVSNWKKGGIFAPSLTTKTINNKK